MHNITVKISDDTYRDARIWAARRDTSISAVMQRLLQTLHTISRAARLPGGSQAHGQQGFSLSGLVKSKSFMRFSRCLTVPTKITGLKSILCSGKQHRSTVSVPTVQPCKNPI